MATERWDDERLDRLAEIVMDIASGVRNLTHDLAETRQIVESNARSIQATNQRLDSMENMVNSNARVIQAIADAIGEAAEERREFRQSMAQQQSQMRGLQYENRQILDILLNRQNRDDNPDAS